MKKIDKLGKSFLVSVLVCFLGTGFGVSWKKAFGAATWNTYDSNKELNICFTPNPSNSCGSLIAKEIAKAKNSIYVQAYGLTHYEIIGELIKAESRGVQVNILVDGSNGNLGNSQTIAKSNLYAHGVELSVDTISRGIAHNKVMIIDGDRVITGSFNFTKSADTVNAENVVLIKNKDVAKSYLDNWNSRSKLSAPYNPSQNTQSQKKNASPKKHPISSIQSKDISQKK